MGNTLEDWFTFQLLALTEIWPMHAPILMGSQSMPGGQLTIRGEHNGKITFRFTDRTGETISEVRTPKIRKVGKGLARMGVIVSFTAETNTLRVRIDGREIHEMDRRYDVTARTVGDRPQTEDTVGIKAAAALRKQQAKSRIKSGFSPHEIKTRWSDLERESRLLRNSIDRLREGDEDYVVSASLHLRKILGDGLLEECAGFVAAEIPVFVVPPSPEGMWTPDHLPNMEASLSFRTMSAHLGLDFTHKVDLAMWREQQAGSFRGKPHTNKQFLLLIADKIGAHADRKRDLVDALEDARLGDIKALSFYLHDLGDTVVTIIDNLVDYKKQVETSK